MADRQHTTDSWHTGCAWLAIDREVVDLGTCNITVGSKNNAGRDGPHGQTDLEWGASAFRVGKERHSWGTKLAVGVGSNESIRFIVEACNFQSEEAYFSGSE